MSLVVFLPFVLYAMISGALGLVLPVLLVEFSSDFIRTLAFLCWEVLITVSIPLLVIDLFKFSVTSWLNFGESYVKEFISSSFSSLLEYTFLKNSCMIFEFHWYLL
jgi:hypothetical protein